MKPVTLMRLRKLASPDQILERYASDQLVVQPKFDGHLALVGTNDEGRIEIRSRRGNDITSRAPGIVNAFGDVLPPNTWLLGELVYVTPDGVMDLHGLQSVMKSKGKPDSGEGEVRFFVFDLLRLDGQRYEEYPYRERMQRAGVFARRAGHPVYEAGMYTFDELDSVVAESLEMGGEGAVIKAADGPYLLRPFGQSEAFGEQWKYKPPEKSRTADVILTDYSSGKAKKIFTAKQYRGGELFEVGKLSGLDRKNEDFVAARIDAGDVVIAEVTYQERLKSGKMRHMGWSRLREDKPVQSVTFEDDDEMAKTKSKTKAKKKTKSKAKNAKKSVGKRIKKGAKRAGKKIKKGAGSDIGRAAIGGAAGGLVAGPVGAAAGAGLAIAAKDNPAKGDMTQARAFIMDCVGRAHVEDGMPAPRVACVEAYKSAGGTKKDGNAACKQLKDEGYIEIKKGECRFTPKGMMHYVQAMSRATANPIEWQDRDTISMTDPDTRIQVTVSDVDPYMATIDSEIEVHDMDDPRRSLHVMSSDFRSARDQALALTNNPHKGARSRTRPGRLDYMTHRGDKDYHRGGHDVVPRPYMNPTQMYRQGFEDRLRSRSRRRSNPDYQFIRDLRDEAGMHEDEADAQMERMIEELQRIRPDGEKIRESIRLVKDHMQAALEATGRLAEEEREDRMDYGGMDEYLRLEAKAIDFNNVIKEL